MLDAEFIRQGFLANAGALAPQTEGFHARMISDSCLKAISRSNHAARQTATVAGRATRTVWERILEALAERPAEANQRWVAKKLGISQPAVALWNKPGGYPTMDNAVELARVLNVNVEWLLTERGPKRPIPQDATAQRLWDIWPELDEGDKRELIGMALGTLRRRQQEAGEEITSRSGTSLTK